MRHPASRSPTASCHWTELAALLAAAAVLLLVDPGAELPIETAEARVPVAARTMAREGLTAVAELGGAPWLKKPPLAVWLQAIAMRLGGETLAMAAAPGGLLAAALALAVARRYGLLAGLALLLSPRFLLSARGAEMDIIFASLTGLAILAGLGEIERRGRLLPLSWLLLGLALIVKGPLCIVFAALAWGRATLSRWLPLVVAPGLAWLAWASVERPDLWRRLLAEMEKGAGDGDATHAGPFWEYVAGLPGLAWPAVAVMVVVGVGMVWKRGQQQQQHQHHGQEQEQEQEQDRQRALGGASAFDRAALLRWSIGGIVVLSLLAKKQTSYALPIYAALAGLAGGAALAERGGPALRVLAVGVAAALVAVASAGFWLPCGAARAGVALVVAAAGLLWVFRGASGPRAIERALLVCAPIVALVALPSIRSFRAERSLVPLGAAIAEAIPPRPSGESPARVVVIGKGWEPVSWGYGADLPAVDGLAAARAAGARFAIEELRLASERREAAAEESEKVAPEERVIIERPHPKHPRRRIRVLELAPAPAPAGPALPPDAPNG